MAFDYEKYLRMEMMPHIWCPGCGNGIVMKAIIRAVDFLKLDKNKVAFVSGIGCTSRLPGYVDFYTLHTTHGRALAFATGLKLARPDLTVIVVSGDGDATAIGGNHFIHSCRRNIDMTLIIFNNFIYGMTGGQVTPTTPMDAFATTSPYGNIENPFDICKLADGAGATFVARGTSYHNVALEKLIAQAIQHKGFSVVEVLVGCPVYYGRKNKFRSPSDLLRWQKEVSVSIKAAEKMKPEELQGKILTGIFKKEDKPELTEKYRELIERVASVR